MQFLCVKSKMHEVLFSSVNVLTSYKDFANSRLTGILQPQFLFIVTGLNHGGGICTTREYGASRFFMRCTSVEEIS